MFQHALFHEDEHIALVEQGRRRLYPSLGNPHYLVLRKRRELFSEWLSGLTVQGLSVLDVGGRVQPYRPLVEERLAQYVAVDPLTTALVDVVGRGENLPLQSNRFDLVFCTQVLEYIPEPRLVISEIHRVLKPGGVLLLSVPAAWPRDADNEYWRFLPAGLRVLLASFSHVEIMPEGYTVAGFFRMVNACLNIFARYDSVRRLLTFTVFPLLNLAGLVLDRFSRTNDQFTVNYSALARK